MSEIIVRYSDFHSLEEYYGTAVLLHGAWSAADAEGGVVAARHLPDVPAEGGDVRLPGHLRGTCSGACVSPGLSSFHARAHYSNTIGSIDVFIHVVAR